MRASISATLPTVATDWYDKYRAVLRDDANGIDKVIRAIRHLRDKATTTAALKDLERELKFFRKHRRRMASLNARGYAIRRCRSRQQGSGQPAHEAGRHALEYEARTSSLSEH